MYQIISVIWMFHIMVYLNVGKHKKEAGDKAIICVSPAFFRVGNVTFGLLLTGNL